MKKRYIVEFGTGVDLHGMDQDKAAQLALKDAISHCCMTGIAEVLEKGFDDISLGVVIAAPDPDKIDVEKIREHLKWYKHIDIELQKGGMQIKGLHVDELGAGDMITMVNAGITVYVS